MRRLIEFNSVRLKLFAGMLLTTMSALLVSGVIIVLYDLRNYHQTWVNDLSTQGELLGAASVPALEFDDPDTADRNLALLRVRPQIRLAAIYDNAGHLFAKFARDPADLPSLPSSPASDGARIAGDNLILFRRITEHDESLGTIYLAAHYQLNERVWQYASIVLGVGVLALLVAMLLSTWMQKSVTSPILAIRDLARRVVEQRDYSLRAERTTRDEVGYLVDAFNDMLAVVARRTEALERSKGALELTTTELRQAKDSLEVERARLSERVEERTAELASAERLLRDMTNGLPGAAFQAEWVDSVTPRFNFISSGFEALTGMSRERVLKDPNLLLANVLEEDQQAFQETLTRSTAQGTDWVVEFRMHRADGSMIWTCSRASPSQVNGRTVWNGYWSDITAEKAAKLELEDARGSALAASHAKSAFLATMSHEIRTPMNAVVGLIDLLLRDSLTAEHRRMISTMRSSTFALLKIIDDILDFSKIEAGRLEAESTPVSILECLESVADMFALRAVDSDLELHVQIDPRLSARILGDGTRIRQILINLVGNAIKFTKSTKDRRGRVTIRGRLVDATIDRAIPLLVVDVEDNGIGLDPSQLQDVFEPFVQGETSTTRRFGGTGLGLTISRRLAALMNGFVDVKSKRHEGSTFTLTLPAIRVIEGVTPRPLEGYKIALVGQSPTPNNYAEWLAYWGSTVTTLNLVEADSKAVRVPDVIVVSAASLDGSRTLSTADVERLSESAPVVLVADGQNQNLIATTSKVVVAGGIPFLPTALLGSLMSAVGRIETDNSHTESTRISPTPPSRDQAEREGTLILVAEDNPANQEVIGRQLALLGYAADMAFDGLEALELWRSGRYGLVLTDIHMPRCDGYDFAATIRNEQTSHVPIIALTADAVQGTLERVRAAGIDDYVRKPVELKTLEKKLEDWLPLRRSFPASEVDESPHPEPFEAIDLSALRRFVGDDPVVQSRILDSFLRHAPASLDEMKRGFDGGNASTIRSASHKLKSSARSVGAVALGDACESMEHAATDEDWDGIKRLFAQMRPLFSELEVRIGDHLRR